MNIDVPVASLDTLIQHSILQTGFEMLFICSGSPVRNCHFLYQ
jgi:hypothetical protein